MNAKYRVASPYGYIHCFSVSEAVAEAAKLNCAWVRLFGRGCTTIVTEVCSGEVVAEYGPGDYVCSKPLVPA